MAKSKHISEFSEKIKDKVDNPEKMPFSDDPRIQRILERGRNNFPTERYLMLLVRELRRGNNPEVLEAICAEIYNMWASQIYPED
jgi:hypothetical protein